MIQVRGIKKIATPKISATIIAIITVGLILTVATTALLNPSIQTIPSNGSVTPIETLNIAVYNDQACTQECTAINWSSVAPGGTTTKTVYIKNTGTTTVSLNMTTSGLTPSGAVGKISATWNKESTSLAANANTTATITLNVDSTITGVTTFSLNVILKGTQV